MDTTIHCLIVDHSVMEDPAKIAKRWVTTPIVQEVDMWWEVKLVKWECCRLDYTMASCP